MDTTLIKPIRNAEHYKHVMGQIELLLDSPTGSPEADFLEILSILADD